MANATMTEDQIGNIIAKAVWRWMEAEKCVELVPWVSDTKSDMYDEQAAIGQKARMEMLEEIEWCMREKLAECYAIRDDGERPGV